MRTRLIALVSVLALVGSAASASASGRDVINDCTDDEVLTKTYTQKEYRDALAQLPADADQYGNCRDIIARAQDAAATKGTKSTSKTSADKTATTPAAGATTLGGGSTGEPSTAPTKDQLATASPEDRAAVEDAARDAASATITPGAVAAERGTDAGTSLSDLPAPVLALIAFLLAGSLGLGAVRLRRLVDTRSA